MKYYPDNWPKTRWLSEYRDLRKLAQISCNALDRLVAFRGFGVFKTVHATDFITHVGRVRIKDVRSYDWIEMTKRFAIPASQYNPHRILGDDR